MTERQSCVAEIIICNESKQEVFEIDAVHTKNGVIDYYDVFGSDGFCINEGVPFYDTPTKKDIADLICDDDQFVCDVCFDIFDREDGEKESKKGEIICYRCK